MRRVLIVAGLLLLVAGFAVGPAAAVGPPATSTLAQPAASGSPAASASAAPSPGIVEGPGSTVPTVVDPPPVAVTLTQDTTTSAVGTSVRLTAQVTDRGFDPTAGNDGRSMIKFFVDDVPLAGDLVHGPFPTFTVDYPAPEAGTDVIRVEWAHGSVSAGTSATHVWIQPAAPVVQPVVELEQAAPTSQAGTDLTLTIRVHDGTAAGRPSLQINGKPQDPRAVGDGTYTFGYSRPDRGDDVIEAVWTQPGVNTATDTVTHHWTPKTPVVHIDRPESSPRNTSVTITVTVDGGLDKGSLALRVEGANARSLTPVRTDRGFEAEYTGTELGTDTIVAVWTQDETAPAEGRALHSWTEALPLDLVVVSGAVADLGASVTLTAHYTPPLNVVPRIMEAPPPPLRVKFLVAGANAREPITALANNVATLTYPGLGVRSPTDIVTAFLIDDEDAVVATSNSVTVTWRTPTVTLNQEAGSAIVDQEHAVVATVAGAATGTLTFAVDGPNVAVEKVQSGTHPTYTLRYRGTAPGTDQITATLALGDAKFPSAQLPLEWVRAAVTVDQATTASQVGTDLVLAATVNPPAARGAVVFAVTGDEGPLTVRDDSIDGGFTATVRRTAVGVDTITATWEDAGARVTSPPITHEWRPEPQPALVVSPGGTSGCARSPFGLTVTARTGDAPIAGLPVTVTATRPGEPTRAFTGVTDTTGLLPLGYTAEALGVDTLTATATIAGTAVSSAPMTHGWQSCALDVTVEPAGSTTTVGSPLAPVVTVRDPAGRPVPGATVAVRITMSGQEDVVADLVTDDAGLATTEYRREAPGTDRITADVTSGDRRGTGTAEHVWVNGALQVSLAPAGTSSVGGSPFTVTALVTDGEKPIVGADIGFLVQMSGQDDLGGPPVRTDADGKATYTWTRTLAGDDAVSVLVVAGDRIGRAATTHRWTLVPTLRLALDPAGTTSRVGTDFTATATVTVDGRPVTGTDVAFTAGRPDRPGTPRPVRTDAAGRAALTYRSADAGTDTITATVTVPNVGQGSASITHLWRAADVVRPPVRRPDLTIRPQQPTMRQPTTRPSPGPRPTPPGSGQPAPAGPAVVEGTHCPPGSQVTLTAGGVVLGTVTADADGNFTVPARLPDLSVGRHKLVASCPPVRVERDLDVVRRSSSTGTGAASASTAAAVLSFFVLLGGQLVRWRSGGGA